MIDDHETNPNDLHHHHNQPSYAQFHAPSPDNHNADSSNATSSDVRAEKRRDHQGDTNDGVSKRSKQSTTTTEYRKDREEWSDAAIGCLLYAYIDKLTQLNRGNLRGRDWEEVAAAISERCEKQSKSVEQCKNKVDNLKKRYKLENHRMSDGGGIATSHWPWFKKMEEIVGNSLPSKAVGDEDKECRVASPVTAVKQFKRYASATPNPAGQTVTMKSKNPKWQRVVLKISGAALACTGPLNIDPKVAMLIAREVAIACHLGVEHDGICDECYTTAIIIREDGCSDPCANCIFCARGCGTIQSATCHSSS